MTPSVPPALAQSVSPQTFYDLPKLLACADRMRADVDVVTIDIFDTLFIRRMHDPDMIKYPVARYIARRAAGFDLKVTMRDAWRARWRIERAHRARHGETYPDHEACYPQYMGEALAELFGDKLPPDLLADVTDFELRLEQAMIVPRAALVDWMKAWRRDSKRIILVSDIYLPATHLERLVRAKELDGMVEDVVSSADSFRAKASGAAWPLLEQRFGLRRDSWLHIGDNPISDGVRPAEFGVRALVIQDARERQRKSIARLVDQRSRRNVFWRGRNLQQLMAPLEAENVAQPPLYVDGYQFFGFLLGNFIHSIALHCQLNPQIRRIYFCSREGWTFKRVWDAGLPYYFPDGDAPQAHYLYVSRMALAAPACANEGLAEIDARVALLPAGSRDFRDVCRIFSFDFESMRPFLDEVGLRDDDPIGPMTPGTTPELRRRFGLLMSNRSFQAEVRRQSLPAQRALERYLESEHFFEDEEVAMVDIGWLGTIQHYLITALSHRDDVPRLHGFLLGATRHVPYVGGTPNFEQYASGVIFDNNRFEFAPSLITNAKDVLEESCRGPHPTLKAYRLNGDGFELEFRRTDDTVAQAEEQQNEYFRPLRNGVLDAAARYAAAATVLGYSPGDLRPWMNFLLIMRLAFPRTAEVDRIRHRSHQDDFAGKHKVPKKILRRTRTLWDRSTAMLRFNPLIRTYYYRRNALDALRGK